MSIHRYNCETVNTRSNRRPLLDRSIVRDTRTTDGPMDLDFFAVRARKLA